MISAAEALEGQISLDIQCLDRIYLNGYVPNLQVGGQVVSFMTQHLDYPLPSPAIFERIGTRFRSQVREYAAHHKIPIIPFSKGDRKIDRIRPLITAAEKAGRYGVIAIGTAQEFQNVFAAHRRQKPTPTGLPHFSFVKADRRVTCFYFYIVDEDFGPCFIKICAYFPYPIKVWCNGHDWAKRQAERAGLDFTPLSNGFATCEDAAALQAICNRLGPDQIEMLFRRWILELPRPLTDADLAAGYNWELSMRQIEVARTLAFSAPRHARSFAEALIRDNLGLGRPHEVNVIFSGRPVRKGPKPTYRECFKTKVVTRGVDVTVNVFFKHSRIKQYLKQGRALRIETVVNRPDDFGVLRRLQNLPQLMARARRANCRILEMQHVGQGCAIGPTLFERIQQPYVREGQRTGALRFGDQRVMALAGALCCSLNAVSGFTNRSLRALVAGLLGTPYGASQMTYDLRRLRLHGLIERQRGYRYLLTPPGLRFAVFYRKLGDRVLTPMLADCQPAAPLKLRRALDVIQAHADRGLDQARIDTAA
jgi:hypothetical protein